MSKKLTDEQLAVLADNFPVSDDQSRISLPKFGMLAKDILKESGSGKSKKVKVLHAAGEFYTEKDLGEVDPETGKKIWTKTFIEGDSVDVIITFFRYQLRRFDSSLNKFISSPVYDNATQIIPLYLDKQIIKRGTQEQLQAMYPKLTQKGKKSSDLQKITILYVLYQGETYHFNLSTSSGWEFSTYKKALNPASVVTTLGSKEETFGTNTYRKVTFTNKGMVSSDDFDLVRSTQNDLKEAVQADSQFFLGSGQSEITDEDFKNI
jgi:hypothetical protein